MGYGQACVILTPRVIVRLSIRQHEEIECARVDWQAELQDDVLVQGYVLGVVRWLRPYQERLAARGESAEAERVLGQAWDEVPTQDVLGCEDRHLVGHAPVE